MLAFFKVLMAMTFAMPTLALASGLRNIMYLTSQHPVFPSDTTTAPVTHVAMSFMRPRDFNVPVGSHNWNPMWQTVQQTRAQFREGVKVLIAIGGWGDTEGFSIGAENATTRTQWATNVAAMVEDTGADGIDVDWEYPGGNGEDYKDIPNEKKAWEIEAYPLLLEEIRRALGPGKIMSAAVPGKVGDMLAFTSATLPTIMKHVDFLNVMTYDMMNRRDTITKHHTGVKLSLEAIQAYIDRGAKAEDLNLGFAFYVKWFKTQHEPCLKNPIGCPTVLMENPDTGVDLRQSGAFAWADQIPDKPAELSESWQAAKEQPKQDPNDGSYYYWDQATDIWWTFDTAKAVTNKFKTVLKEKNLGGVFAWELGGDGPDFSRWEALNKGVNCVNARNAAKREL